MDADTDLLLNEARRLCNSLDGKVRVDELRQQFLNMRIRNYPASRAANQAFDRSVQRAKDYHLLSEDDDGASYRLRE